MRRPLIALVTALAAVVAFAAPAGAIVYGQLAKDGEFDNVGALVGEYDGDLYIFCTGTLVAPTVFLTASHCVNDGERMWVSFDNHVIEPVDPAVNTLRPGTAHAHPKYACCGTNNPYDVAVVVLDDPVTGIAPASLPTLRMLDQLSNRELKAATFTTAGYGTVRETRRTASQALSFDGRLRWGEQSALSLEPAWLNLSMNQATGNAGTCYGDSGGPHFLGSTVVAVTVTGDRWCKATDKDYRIDTPWARDFLAQFVSLP
jgi:secreted trypsin-like serine protease